MVHGRWEGERSRNMKGNPIPPMVHLLSHILRMLSKLVLAHNFEGVGRVPHTSFINHPAYDHRHDPCRVGCRAMPVGRGGGGVLRGKRPTGMHRTSKRSNHVKVHGQHKTTMSKSMANAQASRCQGGGRANEAVS